MACATLKAQNYATYKTGHASANLLVSGYGFAWSMTDLYAVLGVPSTASAKEIRQHFRKRARLLHPDKQPQNATSAQCLQAKKAFQQLSDAYEVLGDEDKRAAYDKEHAPATSSKRKDDNFDIGEYNKRWQDYFDASQPRPPPPPTAQQEAKAERIRREQKERDAENAKKYDLGSHWVKPPKRGDMEWNGWSYPAEKVKKDNDSDASSELSFNAKLEEEGINIGMKLNELDIKDEKEVTFLSPEMDDLVNGQGEVWIIKPPATKSPDQNGTGPKSAGKENARTPTSNEEKKAQQKRCCDLM